MVNLFIFQNANTPMLPSKLPRLKNLEIALLKPHLSPNYDAFSLVSFLDASPALESFTLHVSHYPYLSDVSMVLPYYTSTLTLILHIYMQVNEYVMKHYPVVGDNYECPKQKLDLSHNRRRHMTITGFCSAKSLVELTVHIIESTHA